MSGSCALRVEARPTRTGNHGAVVYNAYLELSLNKCFRAGRLFRATYSQLRQELINYTSTALEIVLSLEVVLKHLVIEGSSWQVQLIHHRLDISMMMTK